MKHAPTKKVQNWIEIGLTVDLPSGVILCAREDHPYQYEQMDPKTGEITIEWNRGGFSITSHQGLMPAFHAERFETLQELADTMRDYADLRTWCMIDHE